MESHEFGSVTNPLALPPLEYDLKWPTGGTLYADDGSSENAIPVDIIFDGNDPLVLTLGIGKSNIGPGTFWRISRELAEDAATTPDGEEPLLGMGGAHIIPTREELHIMLETQGGLSIPRGDFETALNGIHRRLIPDTEEDVTAEHINPELNSWLTEQGLSPGADEE